MAAPIAAALVRIGGALLTRGAGASLARTGGAKAAQVAGGRAAGEALAKAAGKGAVSRIPIAQQVEKLTLKQRATRLGGNLASVADTLSALRGTKGRDEIGLKERVEASESREEQDRQQRVREEEAEQAKQVAKSRTWKMATTGGIVGVALGPGLKKFGDALERLTSTMLERQRELARFSPMIQGVFARMERQQVALQMGRAGVTGRSTVTAGESLMRLRQDLEPLRRASATIGNIMAYLASQTGRAIVTLAKIHPLVAAVAKVAAMYEEKQRAAAVPLSDFIRDVARNGLVEDGRRKELRQKVHDIAHRIVRG